MNSGEGIDPRQLIRGQTWVKEQLKETPLFARDPIDHPLAQRAREEILGNYSSSVLSGTHIPNPPVRGTVYRRGEPLLSTPEVKIKKVLETRISDDGLEFLVEWNEVAGGGQNWISAQQLGPAWHQALNLLA